MEVIFNEFEGEGLKGAIFICPAPNGTMDTTPYEEALEKAVEDYIGSKGASVYWGVEEDTHSFRRIVILKDNTDYYKKYRGL